MNQGFEQFLSEMSVASVMSGLFSLVIAFAWIVIGFVLVRKVHSPAGLVMGIAGLFKLVRFGCCDVLEHFVLGISVAANSEVPQVIWGILSMLLYRVPTIMIVAAVVMMTNHVLKTRAE